MRTSDEVELLLRTGGGLVVRRDHPELGGSFDWLIREGRLATVLPGVYATPEIAQTWRTRARALALRHRDAVLVGAAAARLSFWAAAPLVPWKGSSWAPRSAQIFTFQGTIPCLGCS